VRAGRSLAMYRNCCDRIESSTHWLCFTIQTQLARPGGSSSEAHLFCCRRITPPVPLRI
jgi:hypothetical protein